MTTTKNGGRIGKYRVHVLASAAIHKYFDETANRNIREDLIFAVANVVGPKVAVDCGCGAGADIAYLASQRFTVHGFDVEQEAISRCSARFAGLHKVHLSKSSFGTYRFPRASLVVADASLFFCPEPEFPVVWGNIYRCLLPGGIFCGSFLGPDDTMASAQYNADDYWPHVCVFEEQQVSALLANYEVLRFQVYKRSGITPVGEPHDWHLFSVVARKTPVNAR